jgi:hypothetical protein
LSEDAAPELTPSIRNWTFPVGMPEPGALAVTVAVRTTVVPRVARLLLLRTTVLLVAAFTLWGEVGAEAEQIVDIAAVGDRDGMGADCQEVRDQRRRPVASNVTAPALTPSSLNRTVPVAPAGVTRAVRVTLWPETDAFRLLVRTVVEAAWLTTWINVALPPPSKIAEPP